MASPLDDERSVITSSLKKRPFDAASMASNNKAPNNKALVAGLTRTYEEFSRLLDDILRHTIKITERKQDRGYNHDIAHYLDDSYLRVCIWSGDIIRNEPDGDVSILDVLEILEIKATDGAVKIKAIIDGMNCSLKDLQSMLEDVRNYEVDQTATGNQRLIEFSESSGEKFRLTFTRYLDELDAQKSNIQCETSKILEKEIRESRLSNATQKTHSILCLDGGGIRSYSTLLMLEALMIHINDIHADHVAQYGSRKPTSTATNSSGDDAEKIRPHEIFDYIFGSSSGGLIAIMLGRLKMPIEDCIKNFKRYCKEVFDYPRLHYRLLGPSLGRLIGPKYGDKSILRATRAIIGDFDPKPDGQRWKRNMFSSPTDHCKTAVLAQLVPPGGNAAPYLFRSYNLPPVKDVDGLLRNIQHKQGDQLESQDYPWGGVSCTQQIWEVARATSAAPIYFSPAEIGDRVFVDGGFGSNNPTVEAYQEVVAAGEVQEVGPFAVVSIGSGYRETTYTLGPRRLSNLRKIIRGAFESVTNTEQAHETMQRLANKDGIPYFRFTVPGLDIRLDEWVDSKWPWRNRTATFELIERETKKYLENPDAMLNLRACAEVLTFKRGCRRRHMIAKKLMSLTPKDEMADLQGRLGKAAASGDVLEVSTLLEQNVDVNGQDDQGHTALVEGTMNNKVEVVELLVSHGGNLEKPDERGRTPLQWAAQMGHIDMVKLLLSRGANPDNSFGKGWSPLSIAAEQGHDEVVCLLLESGADPKQATREGWNPLSVACRGKHDAVIKVLDKDARTKSGLSAR